MTYLLLAGAIALEVTGTVSLRLSEGFTRLVPSIVVVVAYLGAIVALAQVLARGVPVGVAYAIWSAAGVALIALVGTVVFREQLTWVQLGGLMLVVAGVAALELGAAD